MATSTLGNGTLVLAGTTSGTTTVTATAVAGTTTLTLPAATDTLVGKATTDTLTNKTLTSPTLTGVATFAAGSDAAPAITTTGDTNTGIFFPAADTIGFSEGGVEAMRITSAGNVNIGTGTAQGKLEIQQSTATAALWVQTGGTTSADVVADFRTGSNAPALQILGNATSLFWSTVGVGNATPSTSGAGITFPATQNASANANTLDDYEEGTFTPTCTLATPGTSATASAAGFYTKVGNLVTVTGRLTFTKGTGSGDLSLGGLPFAATNTSLYQSSGALSLDTFGVAGKVYYIIIAQNSTAPSLVSVTQAGGAAVSASASDFGAAGVAIRYMFSYQV